MRMHIRIFIGIDDNSQVLLMMNSHTEISAFSFSHLQFVLSDYFLGLLLFFFELFVESFELFNHLLVTILD